MEDRLSDLFARQRVLASNFIDIESCVSGNVSEEHRAKLLQTYWALLVEEAVEFLREVPQRKFWRASSAGKTIEYDKLREELADIMHIVVALAMICGLDSDAFYEQYVRKNQINLDRVNKQL